MDLPTFVSSFRHTPPLSNFFIPEPINELVGHYLLLYYDLLTFVDSLCHTPEGEMSSVVDFSEKEKRTGLVLSGHSCAGEGGMGRFRGRPRGRRVYSKL